MRQIVLAFDGVHICDMLFTLSLYMKIKILSPNPYMRMLSAIYLAVVSIVPVRS